MHRWLRGIDATATVVWLVSGKAAGGGEVRGAGTAGGEGYSTAQLSYEACHADSDPGSHRLRQSATRRCPRFHCTYAQNATTLAKVG